MPPTEAREHRRTEHALETLSNWMRPGTHEGITFEISRLTDDLFTDSFLGGGDLSRFTPTGHRGRLDSQLATAFLLDPGGGAPQRFPIQLGIDLDTGTVTGTWSWPASPADTVTIALELFKIVTREDGQDLLFYGDRTSDEAAYSLSMTLL